MTSDPTVGACWDADRLDLPRVWITPDPALLSTARAHEGLPEHRRVPDWETLYAAATGTTSSGAKSAAETGFEIK